MDSFDPVFAFIPILVILFYISMIVFTVYFMVKVLKNQNDIKGFLNDISDKLNQKD
ncbi:hypothetical protein [Rummeliibacillus pycnus]|uniref:hypothetical protein n=1 Tax=Rummeliibacillus pycnus TaxID=101070 RepID=UPI001474595F|nr:hypothetical protein [Rummeliibacillus pycnus]